MKEIIVPDMSGYSEKMFQRTVVEIASIMGYTEAYHTTFSLGSESGFPDLSLFNPMDGGAVFFECKVKKNRPTDRQRMWLYNLRCAGFHAYMVHPDFIEKAIDVLRDVYPHPEIGTGEAHPDLADITCPPTWIGG